MPMGIHSVYYQRTFFTRKTELFFNMYLQKLGAKVRERGLYYGFTLLYAVYG